MLDIAIIVPELAKYGGAERVVVECAAGWQEKHRVTLYASRFNEEVLAEHHVAPNVRRVELSPYFRGDHASLLNGILLPKVWQREIGEHDVYVAHLWPNHLIDLHPMVWYPNEPLRLLHDLRYDETLDFDGPVPRRSVHVYPKQEYDPVNTKYWEASLDALDAYDKLGNPERIVANSRYAAKYLEDVYGRPVPDVVYPGVTVEDFFSDWPVYGRSQRGLPEESLPPGLQPDENIVVTIGQLWPHKRTDLVIQAIRLVENVQLYVVGDGPERGKLKEVAKRLGVADRVFFFRGLSNFELRVALARSMAVVFVPKGEPFGIVALEAMAAGRPLVAADEGGYTEVVDTSCAFLVPPRIDMIAERLRFLRDNPDRARLMGAAGRERARQFTWNRTAEELLAIVEETARSEGTGSRVSAQLSRNEPAEGPLIGVQYFCWYGNGYGAAHWNDNPLYGTVTDVPSMGYYDSSRRSTIEEHFKMIAQAGIDFVVLNLHVDGTGVNHYEHAVIERILRIACRTSVELRFAVQLCPVNATPESWAVAVNLVTRLCNRYPVYVRKEGLPLLYVFWNGESDGRRRRIQRMKEAAAGFIRIATTLRMYDPRTEPKKTFGLFDGFSLFSPLDMAQRDHAETVWQCAYENSAAGARNLRIFTISPGYDDAHLADPARLGNRLRTISRESGATYRSMIDCALSLEPPPDQIIISTFNEFHENTHIEPSLAHGSLYLDMTRDLVNSIRQTYGSSIAEIRK